MDGVSEQGHPVSHGDQCSRSQIQLAPVSRPERGCGGHGPLETHTLLENEG